jgi:archaellum component FlaC
MGLTRDKNRLDELICIKDGEISGIKKQIKDKQEKTKTLEDKIESLKTEYKKIYEDIRV